MPRRYQPLGRFSRIGGILLTVGGVACLSAVPAAGQDLTLVRALVEQKLIEELHRHNSQDDSWYNEKSVDRQKWTSGKLLGSKIRLASWTEQSKTWFWLEDPESNLNLELTRLAVVDGRLHFALHASSRARFRVWGRIPRLVQASVGGGTRLSFEIEGSTAIGGGGLTDTQVTTFNGKLHELRFNNDLGKPFENLVKDALNDYVKNKNGKLRGSIERAIDRVSF